jgi:pfkB family carbohydrate kinase
MQQYDVYGIGNALVDKEFEVEDQFFIDADIEKGFMTLIEPEKQKELVELLTQRYGLKKRAGGGSAANSIYALSQFGGKAFFSCKVANDETGHFYVKELGNQNISTNLSSTLEEGVTGRCVVMVTPDAERTMLTALGISQLVSVEELDYDAIRLSEYAYVEGYLVTSSSARAAVLELKDHAKEQGVKFALTFSDPAMVEYFRDGINEFIGDVLQRERSNALVRQGHAGRSLQGARTKGSAICCDPWCSRRPVVRWCQLHRRGTTRSQGRRHQRRWRHVLGRLSVRHHAGNGFRHGWSVGEPGVGKSGVAVRTSTKTRTASRDTGANRLSQAKKGGKRHHLPPPDKLTPASNFIAS